MCPSRQGTGWGIHRSGIGGEELNLSHRQANTFTNRREGEGRGGGERGKERGGGERGNGRGEGDGM